MSTEQHIINQDAAEPISRLGENALLGDGDYCVLSRQSGGQSLSSYKISYKDLVKKVVSDISARFDFKSMAFCDAYDFSESGHTHGYSYVDCHSEYRDGANQSCIMTVGINDGLDDRQISVFSPPTPDQPPASEPYIGEVRFLAVGGITSDSNAIREAINSGSFDGWVYPDGSEYSRIQGKYDFSQAYQTYGGYNDRFKVPVLSNFVWLNPGLHCQDAIAKMPAQTGIRAHSHGFKPQSDYQELARQMSIKGVIQLQETQNAGQNRNYIHAARNPTGFVKFMRCDQECTLNFNEPGENIVMYYDAVPGQETYPDYTLTPVQIYIGGTLRS